MKCNWYFKIKIARESGTMAKLVYRWCAALKVYNSNLGVRKKQAIAFFLAILFNLFTARKSKSEKSYLTGKYFLKVSPYKPYVFLFYLINFFYKKNAGKLFEEESLAIIISG